MEIEDKAYSLTTEVWQVLDGLGYKATIYDNRVVVDGIIAPRHMNAVRAILGGYLREFFWINGIATIYVKDKNEGLDPDNERYNTLMRCIYTYPSSVPAEKLYRKEVLVNMGDFFVRKTVGKDNLEKILKMEDIDPTVEE